MVDEVRRDPVTGDAVVVRRSGGGGSTLVLVLLVIAALAALAYFTGFLGGTLPTAPKVSVEGGSPGELHTGKIVTGTHKEVVEVPDVKLQKAPDAKH